VTREEILQRYPQASEGFIRANGGESRRSPKPVEPVTIVKPTDEQKLNKTERDYLAYLRALGGDWIGVQNITLKLADDTRFTPDFAVLDRGEMRFIDVKGFQREDALIKIKVAARLFPFAKFLIVKRDGSAWNHIEVKP